MPRPVHGDAVLFQVNPVQGRGEAVRVAFAPDLAIRDDVEPGFFLRPYGYQRRVALGFLEIRLRNAPQLPGAYPRRQAACKPGSIDKPFRLWIASYERGRE